MFDRLHALAAAGVRIVDERQVWIADDVDLNRIRPGAILHPGTRLLGARCFVGKDAEVGCEGPATLDGAILDERAKIMSGFAQGIVLLRDAIAGSNAHLRPGTIFEEEASTAHAVGLKHTILLSFVTVGSLVNLCDCLVAGGTSRQDHSEVGSGFIHFNFTPWGESGDKATPSLVGDVVRGVFLREKKIFLGGAGGMVGPGKVGYGAIVGAGRVLRREVLPEWLVVGAPRRVERPLPIPEREGGVEWRVAKNLEFVGNLIALREWYREVRLARVRPEDWEQREVLMAAIETIGESIAERKRRLVAFLVAHGRVAPSFDLDRLAPSPLAVEPGHEDHVAWVRALDAEKVRSGQAWLSAIVAMVKAHVPA